MKTRDKLQFTEYTLEYRYDKVHMIPSQGKTSWINGAGYNNLTSTYNHLHQVKAQITRSRRYLEKFYTGVQFRTLRREVTRTEWEELDAGA